MLPPAEGHERTSGTGLSPGAIEVRPRRSGDCACLQESEKAHERSIILPLYRQTTESEQTKVVSTLRSVASPDGRNHNCGDNVLTSKVTTGT